MARQVRARAVLAEDPGSNQGSHGGQLTPGNTGLAVIFRTFMGICMHITHAYTQTEIYTKFQSKSSKPIV